MRKRVEIRPKVSPEPRMLACTRMLALCIAVAYAPSTSSLQTARVQERRSARLGSNLDSRQVKSSRVERKYARTRLKHADMQLSLSVSNASTSILRSKDTLVLSYPTLCIRELSMANLYTCSRMYTRMYWQIASECSSCS